VMAIAHTGELTTSVDYKRNPWVYIAIKFDTYVIFFQNYGWEPHPPSNMATIITINRKLAKKFIKKLF
jgi:hypothetical protein